MIRTIVVPTDCSELSRRALRYADRIARRTGGTIVAVYGERFSARLEGEGVAAALAGRDDLEWMEGPIRQQMTALLASALSPETARKIVIADEHAAEAIVEVAERRGADLIVMGTHDRNRLMRAVLGSVTDTVLAETHRPVLILREHNDAIHDDPIRRILCPFRDSPASRAAIANAVALGEAFGAELRLVQMVQDEASEEAVPEWLASMASPAAMSAMQRLKIADAAGAQLVALADEVNADLIVIGTSHRRFSDSGAPAAHVVRTAHCPVLAVTVPVV